MCRFTKWLRIALITVLCLSFSLLFVACGGGECKHEWKEMTFLQGNCRIDGVREYLCPLCEEEKFEVVRGDHSYSEHYDSDEHYQICDFCGDKQNVQSHTYLNCVCTCGVTAHGEGVYAFDENGHWNVCSDCGKENTAVGHTTIGLECECGYNGSVVSGLAYKPINGGTAWEISEYVGLVPDLKLPSKFNGKPIVAIADEVFKDNDFITSVEIPMSIKEIGWYAFANCEELETITFIGNGLEIIGDYAFANSDVASLNLPKSVKKIGRSAFYGCNYLSEVIILSNVEFIGYHAFYPLVSRGPMMIFCETESQPTGWSAGWCSDSYSVVWGYSQTD